jgi:hypothetical protein
VMQQELEAKQNIQQNLINFMTALRQEYWDTANAYIISQYERANNLLNAISQNIASTNANIATARLSAWGGWWQQQQNEDAFPTNGTWLQQTNWLADHRDNLNVTIEPNSKWDIWYQTEWWFKTLIPANKLKQSNLTASQVVGILYWTWS